MSGRQKEAAAGRPAAIPLSNVVRTVPPAYPSVSVEQDRGAAALDGYIPGAGTLEVVAKLGAGMRGGRRGHAISVTGPYGSGKSTMAVFLNGLAAPSNSAEWDAAGAILRRADPRLAAAFDRSRAVLGIRRRGMIRCFATARREPVGATILRALDSGARGRFGGRYGRGDFEGAAALARAVQGLGRGAPPAPESVADAAKGLCAADPALVVIDELGKSIEYFADENSREGDLFLLQELAEMSGGGRGVPLFMVTMQHMAFEEHAAGASHAQRREWAKVQGRFDDVPFANSPEQARLLAASVLRREGGGEQTAAASKGGPAGSRAGRAVEAWAGRHAREAASRGLGGDLNKGLLLSCYPLHPLALEVIPEMCSRYGQHERTLISFMTGGGAHTVSRFISEGSWDGRGELPAVRLDTLYDYFVSGSSLVRSLPLRSSRLMEIETLIRDTQGLSVDEELALKAVGVLNLVGRAGRLRASRAMVGYATGFDPGSALKSLERRSLVTYRRHSDEYRIWHGTDVDIQARLEIARRKLAAAPLADMLKATLPLGPVVAARHALQTGTTRIFERVFADPADAGQVRPRPGFDGVIVYLTGRRDGGGGRKGAQENAVEAENLEDLREAALEAASIRDVHDNSPEVQADWVARRELGERLAWAESSLERAFEGAFGCARRGRGSAGAASPSSIASDLCDRWYPEAPRIFNETINRNALTGQGSAALRKVLDAMIGRAGRPLMGIEGWGPERAIYEAALARTGIHRASGLEHGLRPPSRDHSLRPAWDRIVGMARDAGRRIPVTAAYEALAARPYGIKSGLLPVIMTAALLVCRDRLALYEHGTYCRALTAEIAERMVKNPAHFEVKHVGQGSAGRAAVDAIAKRLGVEPAGGAAHASVLGVVSHLVKTYAALTPHIKRTGHLSRNALAARHAIETAVEPDTLLLESLPRALGRAPIGRRGSRTADGGDDVAEAFAADLSQAVSEMGSAFDALLDGLIRTLLKSTSIRTRKNLADAARAVAPSVLDHDMKVFLTAVANDALERDRDWISYVALTLTGVPPANWSDEQRALFTNRLKDASARFARLSSMHFAEVSGSYSQHACMVTVTHADGREDSAVVSIPEPERRRVREIADRAVEEMRAGGRAGGDADLRALVAELGSRMRAGGRQQKQRRRQRQQPDTPQGGGAA